MDCSRTSTFFPAFAHSKAVASLQCMQLDEPPIAYWIPFRLPDWPSAYYDYIVLFEEVAAIVVHDL